MEDLYIVNRLKSAFFDYISENKVNGSIDEVISELTAILQRELYLKSAVFYFYNKKTDSLSSHKTIDYIPLHSIPHIFENGQAFRYGEELLIPIHVNKDMIGIIHALESNRILADAELAQIVRACSSFYSASMSMGLVSNNDRKYEKLYLLTEKFHSLLDKDEVLIELITTLQSMYDEYIFYLFLSHDNDSDLKLPIKDLAFDDQDGNGNAMEAYVTGNVQLSHEEKDAHTILYSPLKGKQGVYGVLQVVVNNGANLEEDDKNFIVMLANTAGTALENAQLYEQSKRLIKDLQVINETSHRLNKNLRLTDTMTFMSSRIMDSFDADEVGLFYLNEDGTIDIFPGSTPFFNTSEVQPYVDFIRQKLENDLEGLFIGDMTSYLDDVTYASIMAVPMVQSDTLKGCALVLNKKPYHFSFDMFKLLQSLIHHSTLALTNSLLREELETLVKTDHLTQLFSRNYMNNVIESSMKVDRQGTFILIDIDNFKRINDTFGHQTGDDVLVQVADIIRGYVRENDIGARWGGEELAIYLPQVDLQSGIAIAERIVKKVGEQTNPSVTISAGVSYWNAESEKSFDRLFSKADRGLYVAKDKGKNRVVVQV
ncbi:sensor domain-containing diguanylate cyclase [Bacillus weihaiensis]|uniref:sensor domain-containing diguanylate cyclase n=1 Tax=Bacillus weihaiensis TaxID=1547283 RepID=UPI002354639F|nr:diguanylate cyclase [Bacillus weihaiensis]